MGAVQVVLLKQMDHVIFKSTPIFAIYAEMEFEKDMKLVMMEPKTIIKDVLPIVRAQCLFGFAQGQLLTFAVKIFAETGK